MKRFIVIISFLLALSLSQAVYAQVGMTNEYKPYRNLAKWYGTQAAPTSYEKAQWALDDINAYRTEQGLSPLSESILKSKTRFRLFRRNR